MAIIMKNKKQIREKALFEEACRESIISLRASPLRSGRYLNVNGKKYVDFTTASYLGLDCDKSILKSVLSILESCGIGRCSSPLYAAPKQYQTIEKKIREITGIPQVFLFNSTSMANMAAIKYGLPHKFSIFVDEYCHRSVVEAFMLRNRPVCRYPHLDLSALRSAMERTPSDVQSIVITDGVFSMSGETASIPELLEITRMRNGYLIVDDAHGFGIYGNNGEGVLHELPDDAKKRVIYIGSLTKALSGFGGFIACSEKIGERIKLLSPQYGFSCSIPLIYAASSAYACSILGSSKWKGLVEKLKENWENLNYHLGEIGVSLLGRFSPIAVIQISQEKKMRQTCLALNNQRIAFNPVSFPAIKRGDFRLRFCLSAVHSFEDMDKLISILKKVLI